MRNDETSPANQSFDLIGDGSQPYALPTLTDVKFDRFKRIDGATLVKLIDGDFKETIESFTIVDCRYPYEYHGGHIVNSLNIHSELDLIRLFFDKEQDNNCDASSNSSDTEQTNQQPKPTRRIIIFHCEFSSERGPRLMKFLRERDRQMNQYPELNHPELYLLEGGYSQFFSSYKEYCVPQAYRPMRSKHHKDELRSYRRRKMILHDTRKENRSPDISFEG